MTTTFALTSLTYQGKVYQSASVEVDEQARRLDLSYVKESFLKKEKVHLVAVYFDELTKPQVEVQKVTLGDAVMILGTEGEAAGLGEILKGPYRSALNSIRDLVSGPVAKFLVSRAETLASLDALKKDYRKTILASEDSIPKGSKDPFDDVFSARSGQLERPLGVALEALDGFLGLSPPRSEKPYAFMYGVCSVQDAMFRGEGVQDSFQTLAALGLGAGQEAKESSIEDLTDRLVKLAAGQPQLLY